MKKLLILSVITLLVVGCHKDDLLLLPEVNVSPELKITNSVGIKLESSFVTSEVAMNVKSEYSGSVTIKIFDIANRVVSKEVTTVKVGDNILKVYTTALPRSAYRIGLFDSNDKMLGITDFNKL
jgi:hypothetical protein